MFSDGLSDISSFGDNLGDCASDNNRLLETNNLSLSSLLYKLLYFISFGDFSKFYLFNILLIGITFVVATVSTLITQDNFSRAVICSSTIALIPSVSYFYVLSFMIIPFLEFIKNYDRIRRYKQVIYKFFFMFLFFTSFIRLRHSKVKISANHL